MDYLSSKPEFENFLTKDGKTTGTRNDYNSWLGFLFRQKYQIDDSITEKKIDEIISIEDKQRTKRDSYTEKKDLSNFKSALRKYLEFINKSHLSEAENKIKNIKLGMVGGGKDAFIGEIHRRAAGLCGNIDFCAGALSSTPKKSKESGRILGLSEDRNYESWEEMLEKELKRPLEKRIDLVSIVTPNHIHYPVAKAFGEEGIHIISDKPLVHTSEQAGDLCKMTKEKGIVFAVTYNYTGYPLVKQARALIKRGEIGTVRKVVAEYSQGWLSKKIEQDGAKQAEWRTDPNRSGIAGAIGDIGSHAENLVATVTGLEISEISADITTFVPGRRLDDDGNLLIRYTNGAKGVMIVSQISCGEENGLKLKVYGEAGGFSWCQEQPNTLSLWKEGMPEQVYRRGNPYLDNESLRFTHTPPGHPEGFLEAFSSIYSEVTRHILAVKNKTLGADDKFDYPTVFDGAKGVKFIEKVIESASSDTKWIKF